MILRIMEIEKVFAGPHDLTTGNTSAVETLTLIAHFATLFNNNNNINTIIFKNEKMIFPNRKTS